MLNSHPLLEYLTSAFSVASHGVSEFIIFNEGIFVWKDFPGLASGSFQYLTSAFSVVATEFSELILHYRRQACMERFPEAPPLHHFCGQVCHGKLSIYYCQSHSRIDTTMSDQNTSTPLNEQEGASPLPGCIILISILVVFGGLVVLYIGVGYWMNAKINSFTANTPELISVPEATQTQIDAVYNKLDQLTQATEKKQMIRISFSVDDINTLIATEPLLADYKGKALVEKIDSRGMHTKVNQQIRNLPFRPNRFLNATISFVPVVLKESVVFEIHDIRVVGKEVPQDYIESYSKQDFFKLDTKNEDLKPVLMQLRRTYLEEDRLIVETGKDPADG